REVRGRSVCEVRGRSVCEVDHVRSALCDSLRQGLIFRLVCVLPQSCHRVGGAKVCVCVCVCAHLCTCVQQYSMEGVYMQLSGLQIGVARCVAVLLTCRD